MDFKRITTMIENFGKNHASYWGCALAGETGEACNLIKKHERDSTKVSPDLARELADVFVYLELTARFFDIDLQSAIIDKIAVVNHKRELRDQGVETVDCDYCGYMLAVGDALILPSVRDEEEIPTRFHYFCNWKCCEENEVEEHALGQEVMGGY